MDLFNIIPENFFSLLSSKNKRIYQQSIFQIFSVYEQSSILGIDKKIVVDDLVNFLTKNHSEFIDDNQEEDFIEVDISNKRDLANHILRRMERCGWISIDITSDYIEILNFTDYAITVIEALLTIKPIYFDEYDMAYMDQGEDSFQGYIYTIYSLLLNKNNVDYAILVSEIIRYTKLLLRSLRKLDARLKDYLTSVVEASDVKELMEKLLSYKTEVFDSVYNRLKTSDNINKYRLEIVNNLEDILNDESAMRIIIEGYAIKMFDFDTATRYAFRQINEVIEVFNTFDDLINLIDAKIKNYVKSTIGKIKFLLSEEDNILGKLNGILKYIKQSKKDNKLDKAVDMLRKTTTLKSIRYYNDKSLYQPRGSYAHSLSSIMDFSRMEILESDLDFMNSTLAIFEEKNIIKFLSDNFLGDMFFASDIIKYDSPDELILQVVYTLLYSTENGYVVSKLDDMIKHYKFEMPNFSITKGSL